MMSKFGACNLSIVPIRADASDKSEIVTQLLFGECFEILEQTDKWVNIQTCFDDYQGWIDAKQYAAVKNCLQQPPHNESSVLAAVPYLEAVRLSTTEKLYLLAGSNIPEIHSDKFFLGIDEYQLKSELPRSFYTDFDDSVGDVAKFYLGAPYLWGGRTIFGIDCSGLTQIVFKILGKRLPRDAWQQAERGEVVNFLQEAKAGDLAFFDNEEGRVTHVGIMLDNQHIIHASGKVRIDLIDGQGIYSRDLGRHTHKLRIIKRVV